MLPGLPGYGQGISQNVIPVLVSATLIVALIAVLGFWRRAGFVGLARWRNPTMSADNRSTGRRCRMPSLPGGRSTARRCAG